MQFLSLIFMLLASFLIIHCWSRYNNNILSIPTELSLSIGLFLGISSQLFFLSQLFLEFYGLWGHWIELSVWVVVILLCLHLIKIRPSTEPTRGSGPNIIQEDIHKWLRIGFWMVVLLSFIVFALRYMNGPHGGWDGWAIWNLRARFLYRGEDQWLRAFSTHIGWSHPDYPLLIPANIARWWHALNNETTLVPMGVSLLFTYATVGLMVSVISLVHSRNYAWIAGITLLSLTAFTNYGVYQTADIPVGFYMLATLVLFFLRDSMPGEKLIFLLVAGMMAGFAAWTKNEGQLFILSMLIAHFIVTITTKNLKLYGVELLVLVSGLLLATISLIYFKLVFAPSNHLVAAQNISGMLEKLGDSERYIEIAKYYNSAFWDLFKGRIFIFILCLILFGAAWPKRHTTSMTITLLTLCLMILGYFLVYVLTPYDLTWHLKTSTKRLFTQLLPSFVFAFFIFIKLTNAGSLVKQKQGITS